MPSRSLYAVAGLIVGAAVDLLIVTTQATCSRVAGMNGLPDKAS
jgi:hypothetical protein